MAVELLQPWAQVCMRKVVFQLKAQLCSDIFARRKLGPLCGIDLRLEWHIQSIFIRLLEEVVCAQRAVYRGEELVKSGKEVPLTLLRVHFVVQISRAKLSSQNLLCIHAEHLMRH